MGTWVVQDVYTWLLQGNSSSAHAAAKLRTGGQSRLICPPLVTSGLLGVYSQACAGKGRCSRVTHDLFIADFSILWTMGAMIYSQVYSISEPCLFGGEYSHSSKHVRVSLSPTIWRTKRDAKEKKKTCGYRFKYG